MFNPYHGLAAMFYCRQMGYGRGYQVLVGTTVQNVCARAPITAGNNLIGLSGWNNNLSTEDDVRE